MVSASQLAIETVAADNAEDEVVCLHDARGEKLVPYVKTAHSRVEVALDVLRLTTDDIFVDLGCGDGRVALAAAAETGAHAVGIEISPALLRCCHRAANQAGFDCASGSRLRFLLADFATLLFEAADVPDPPKNGPDDAEALDVLNRATAIYVYLLPLVMPKLTPYLLRAMARGARVLVLDDHLPSASDANAVAALPSDCRALAHYLTPIDMHVFGKMRLHSAPSTPSPRQPITSIEGSAKGLVDNERPPRAYRPLAAAGNSSRSPSATGATGTGTVCARQTPSVRRATSWRNGEHVTPQSTQSTPSGARGVSMANVRAGSALLAHALPRRTQIPNRLEPFDCTLAAAALQRALAHAHRWCKSCTVSAGSAAGGGCAPVSRQVVVGARTLSVFEARGDFATRLWYSSMMLAEWLEKHAATFNGAGVLEVGAGTGLCALTVAAASARARVIASDVSFAGLEMISAAARAQSLSVECIQFDICDGESLPADAQWLVASDVLYTPQLARALAERCIEILRRGGRAVVADPGRPTRRLFQSILEREGLRSDFRPLVTPPDDRRLVLLHVAGEHSVSDFAAHAELEG